MTNKETALSIREAVSHIYTYLDEWKADEDDGELMICAKKSFDHLVANIEEMCRSINSHTWYIKDER